MNGKNMAKNKIEDPQEPCDKYQNIWELAGWWELHGNYLLTWEPHFDFNVSSHW